MKKIDFYHTHISNSAIDKVAEILKTTFLSEGEIVRDFENKLQEKLDIFNPVAVNSGTSALHLALIHAGIKAGDEVIIPAQTFVATGLSVLYCGAKPVFADIQYNTGNISPDSIEKKITSKTKAIIPVHWGGYPCDLDEIQQLADKYNLIVIEDAAHALGAMYKNKHIGTISNYTCFSFQAIKHLTTGDGGAICSKSKQVSDELKKLRWFGIDRYKSNSSDLGERQYDIKALGYKYHMNNYAAALGIANLEDINFVLLRRKKIAMKYNENLANVPGIKLFNYKNNSESSYWQWGMHVKKRENFIQYMKQNKIPVSVIHQGIDKNTIFGGKNIDLLNQRKFDETQIHLPIHSGLEEEQVDYIIDKIKKGW